MLKVLLSLFFSFFLIESIWALDDLQSRISSLSSQIPTSNGPNCWNSVLKFSGLVSNLRYTTPEELKFWLSSKYCRKIESLTELQPGDIIRIHEKSGDLHAMIWLDNENVFSKTTSHVGDNYEIIRADLIYSSFRVDQEACRIPAKGLEKFCNRWSDFYRCDFNVEDQVQFEQKNPDYQTLHAALLNLANQLQSFLFSVKPSATEAKNMQLQFQMQLNPIKQSALQLDQQKNSPFFWKALRLEVEALQIQISILAK